MTYTNSSRLRRSQNIKTTELDQLVGQVVVFWVAFQQPCESLLSFCLTKGDSTLPPPKKNPYQNFQKVLHRRLCDTLLGIFLDSHIGIFLGSELVALVLFVC